VALDWLQAAGDQAQQGGLANAVGANNGGPGLEVLQQQQQQQQQ